MADKSAIEWTEATWNPTVGCSIVSPGCTNCYAMHVARGLEQRFGSEKYRGLTKQVNGNTVWTGEVRLDEAALLQPLKWKRGRRIFVNSMSDLFHESLTDKQIDRVFAVMAQCPQHTFQVLTKRSARMREYVTARHDYEAGRAADNQILHPYPVPTLPNVWHGVSAERQKEADERIPDLLATPAAVRFVSLEPLIGPIDLCGVGEGERVFDALRTRTETRLGWADHHRLDWVIVGGESGKGARPMHPAWARSLQDQCATAGVPFFFKQWGEYANEVVPTTHVDMRDLAPNQAVAWGDGKTNHVRYTRIGKKAAGRLLDGVTHDGFPEVRA